MLRFDRMNRWADVVAWWQVDFLDLYGRTLNMKDVGVSCRDGGRFFRKKDRR